MNVLKWFDKSQFIDCLLVCTHVRMQSLRPCMTLFKADKVTILFAELCSVLISYLVRIARKCIRTIVWLKKG